MDGMRKGIVKYFTGSYGFITPADGGGDVWFPGQVLRFFEIGMVYPEDRIVFKSTPSPTEPGKDVIRWMALDDGRDEPHEATVIQARRGAR